MNLAIRGLECNLGPQWADTFHKDLHPDLRADFILANPPFNISDWGGDKLQDDKRWKFGHPAPGNANYAWVQHIVHHLAPAGIAGFVLANGSLSSNQSGEGEIRKAVVEADLVDCMVTLPGQLFYSTPIPVCLWFLTRTKSGRADSPSRLAKIALQEKERPKIDPEFEQITETEEATEKNRLAHKWSRLEAMVGTDRRLDLIARDIVDHFEKRHDVMDGKAMIVCMSRRICVDLYAKLIALRPNWDSQDFGKGALKVVMTGSAADPERYKRHLMTGHAKKLVENRFKDPKDPLKIVIVRDMWLTGFDVPCLHTMYIDKPSQGHTLMQTIARVNRVFHDRPGGLVVDYLGLTEELKEAIKIYTSSGGHGKPAFNQQEAIAIMREKHEILCGIFHDFDWSGFIKGNASKKLNVLKEAVEFILGIEDGPDRVLTTARQLMAAFALSVPSPEAMKIRDDVGFFQAVKAQLAKLRGGSGGATDRDLDTAIKQLVSKSVATDEVIDVFKKAGLDNPEVSILDDAFLDQFKDMPQKNLAVEMLRRLLSDEIRKQAKKNLVMSRSFAQLLEEAIHKYQNRTLEAAAIIAELVKMAKDLKASLSRGQKLGLNDAEMAFYDALGTNDSAVAGLGDVTLKAIARDLVKGVRKSVTIDWTIKEAVRAKIRTMVKRILRNHDYPPDKQEQATQTVLAQAELLCADWAT